MLGAADAPSGLVRRVADRETETEQAQSRYTYRQSVTIEELDQHGARTGEYRELRDVVFSPNGPRFERVVGKPFNSLRHLLLTEEDFRDIREVQPALLTRDRTMLYETAFRGEETVDGTPCWVLRIRPRQILQGQRLFEGLLWIDKSDDSIIRTEGQAVPEIRTTRTENLFPHFTTIRRKVDGRYWLPAITYGDDTLYFRTGPQRIRLTIRYSDYRQFGADVKITFGESHP